MLFLLVYMNGVWFVEYNDDICNDTDMVIDIDNSADLQSSETEPQLNHLYDKANGDLENDIDSVNDVKHVPAAVDTLRRQSSVGSNVYGPVNGIRTREHNLALQKLAIVEVKKPGKGSMFLLI